MILCLTGGIGSGKTTVAKMFDELGVPTYISDIEAKKLMVSSKEIRNDIIEEFGDNSYNENEPNTKYLALIVFNNTRKLEKLNAIIHPRVAEHFKNWYKKQNSGYIIKESAVLFESGEYKNCNKIILVTAPKEERIKRVMKRDHVTRKDVMNRIKNQWTDKEKKKYADYIIRNSSSDNLNAQIIKIHKELLKII